eukprot:m.190045 g.190045  ORF g.190045 m.190045 type:complete len:74 (+) comp13632_c0_seq17:231-452(+)
MLSALRVLPPTTAFFFDLRAFSSSTNVCSSISLSSMSLIDRMLDFAALPAFLRVGSCVGSGDVLLLLRVVDEG